MDFTDAEKLRYSRHFRLPALGIEGQKRLKQARVLVVGTGGLGAPLLQYLTAAGIGTIGIVDYDTVDASNLHRQVLFSENDIGRKKTAVAVEKLSALNPHVKTIIHNTFLNSQNAMEIIGGYDIVADGTDNFPARYLVNDACVLAGKTNVYASIFQFEGQVSVFNAPDENGMRGPNYRDLHPLPPPPGLIPNCAEGGVLGVLPGIIGSIQASEVIKLAAGIGQPLSGRLLIFDTLEVSTRILKIRRDPSNPISGDQPTIHELMDYEAFCGGNDDINEIDVAVLKAWRDQKRSFLLLDVREEDEYENGNIGGRHVPLSELDPKNFSLPADQPVVFMCRSGARSRTALERFNKNGRSDLYNLKGGILAWKEHIDPEILVV